MPAGAGRNDPGPLTLALAEVLRGKAGERNMLNGSEIARQSERAMSAEMVRKHLNGYPLMVEELCDICRVLGVSPVDMLVMAEERLATNPTPYVIEANKVLSKRQRETEKRRGITTSSDDSVDAGSLGSTDRRRGRRSG